MKRLLPADLFKIIFTHVIFPVDDEIFSLVKAQYARQCVIVCREKLHLNLFSLPRFLDGIATTEVSGAFTWTGLDMIQYQTFSNSYKLGRILGQ